MVFRNEIHKKIPLFRRKKHPLYRRALFSSNNPIFAAIQKKIKIPPLSGTEIQIQIQKTNTNTDTNTNTRVFNIIA